jgi:hypothetical protein
VNIVNQLKEEDYTRHTFAIDSILDQRENDEFIKEIDIFINRSKSLLNKYYEDLNTIDRLNGLEKQELFLALKESPKRLQKYYK